MRFIKPAGSIAYPARSPDPDTNPRFSDRIAPAVSLRSKRSYNPVLMNPASMAEIGVDSGELVRIESRFGGTEGVVEASESVGPGVIALAHGWGDPEDPRDVREKGCNVQRLIPNDHYYDEITGMALQSAVPVNVSAARG